MNKSICRKILPSVDVSILSHPWPIGLTAVILHREKMTPSEFKIQRASGAGVSASILELHGKSTGLSSSL